jgi:hypothetical protein
VAEGGTHRFERAHNWRRIGRSVPGMLGKGAMLMNRYWHACPNSVRSESGRNGHRLMRRQICSTETLRGSNHDTQSTMRSLPNRWESLPRRVARRGPRTSCQRAPDIEHPGARHQGNLTQPHSPVPADGEIPHQAVECATPPAPLSPQGECGAGLRRILLPARQTTRQGRGIPPGKSVGWKLTAPAGCIGFCQKGGSVCSR